MDPLDSIDPGHRPPARRHRPVRRQPRKADRRLAWVTTLVIATSLLAGCARLANPEPRETPAAFPGITRILGYQGIAVEGIVAGDAGCSDQALAKTAISFQARGLDQTTPLAIRIYRFKNEDALQRNLGAIADCARTYVTDPETVVQIVEPPYVVMSQGPWAPEFTRTFESGLVTAATEGG